MKPITSFGVRHLVVIGVALVAVAVLAVAVTFLATGGGEQPERERTVTTTSSEIALSAEEKRCQAISVERSVVRDRFEDLTITQPTTRITPSCVLVDGTAIALPTMVITGQFTFQLPEGSLSQ